MGLFNYFKTTTSYEITQLDTLHSELSNKKLYDGVEKKKNHVYSDNVFFVHKEDGLDYRVEFTTFDRLYFFKDDKLQWLPSSEIVQLFIGEKIKYKIG